MPAVFKTLSEISSAPVDRINTGISGYVDEFFGITKYDLGDGIFGNSYGLPRGAIIMVAGEAGVGKSRFVGEIAANANNNDLNVMVFQGEARLSAFKSWGCNKKVKNPDKYLVSDCKNPVDQVSAIREQKPDLVIIDSVNVLENCNYSDVKGIMEEYIKVVGEVNCCLILIGQLDNKGKVRGSLDWTFLPDTVVLVQRVKGNKKINVPRDSYEKEITDSSFSISIPQKNRYGVSGVEIIMNHVDNGVKYIGGNIKC